MTLEQLVICISFCFASFLAGLLFGLFIHKDNELRRLEKITRYIRELEEGEKQ